MMRSVMMNAAVATIAAMSFAAPASAHWGSSSATAVYGVDQYCNHADAGNTNVRRARVRLILNAYWVSYEGGGYWWYWDTIQIKNVGAGRADAFASYVGPSVPPGAFGDFIQVDNIEPNTARIVGNWWETNGMPNVSRAYCQVRNG